MPTSILLELCMSNAHLLLHELDPDIIHYKYHLNWLCCLCTQSDVLVHVCNI